MNLLSYRTFVFGFGLNYMSLRVSGHISCRLIVSSLLLLFYLMHDLLGALFHLNFGLRVANVLDVNGLNGDGTSSECDDVLHNNV